ncbi:hypothetical protein GN138_06585 [Winogradskyella sp. HL2-2]|uniref:Carboxypeptidase-like regulatory domain-containing protein n=1 Tax=Winogradskyella endarachnes TaxID=2681965 RepID=A0A6L6U739_9FLAO|nr:hypothetical protein [Winogradskyella endarachnes]
MFRILNVETNAPVPYATIRFAKTKNDTIANVLGDFRIPFRYKNEQEILNISCIGYYSKKIKLNNLENAPYHVIYLTPKTEELTTVVINSKKKHSTKNIVQKAIDNIETNYPIEPYSYIGYYRDYQFVDEEYFNLNEGIVEVFDKGFKTHKISNPLNQTALYRYKLNSEFAQDSLLSHAIYNGAKQIKDGKMGSAIGNELTLLNIHNPIRNYNTGSFSFVYVFKTDFIKNHSFKNKGLVFLDNEELYKTEFSALKNITGSAYKASGYIYISKLDFAIHQFEYKLYSISPRQLILSLNIEYNKQENGKMYLNYITFNNNFFITQNEALQIESSYFNNSNQRFVIKFNRALDLKSIEKLNNIKITFKDRKLSIYNIEAIDKKTIEVQFKKEDSNFLNENDYTNQALFDIRLKNFQDVLGLGMGKSKLEGHQFRELFVQSVNFKENLSSNLKFIDKGASLNSEPINNVNIDDYWLNSPLKEINTNMKD